MKKIFIFLFVLFIFLQNSYADIDVRDIDTPFFIGKMDSHNNNFALYFKTREKAILARGEEYNYITDYPQDLYYYDYKSKKNFPLISYEWFPTEAKRILKNYDFPVFPEDFAYYLLKDNNTLVMVSAIKNLTINLQYDIKSRELKVHDEKGKLNFIVSTYAQNCGFSNLKSNYKCNLYKPLISENLIN